MNLLNNLLKGYRKDIPPMYTRDRFDNISRPNSLFTTILSGKMLSMNENRQVVEILVEWMAVWTDYRLQWDPEEYNGIEVILINKYLVWLPDAMPDDLTGYDELMSSQLQSVVVYPNGTCMIQVAATFNQLCRLNIEYFPFDVQVCEIKLSSINYISSEFVLSGSIDPSVIPSDFGNAAWSVDSLEVRNEMTRNDINNYDYSRIVYSISLRRSSTYYVILIIIPSVIITSLTVLGMFWSEINEHSYQEKVTLGFSSFLAQTVILQITTQSIPATSNLPVLAIYILLNLCILFASVIVVLLTATHFNCEAQIKLREDGYKLSPSPYRRLLGILWLKAHFLYSWLFMILTMTNFLVLILRRQ